MKRVLVLSVIIALAAGSSLAQPSSSPWPMFRHDARHTGRSTCEGPSACLLKWSYTTGVITASAAVGTNNSVYIGTDDCVFSFTHTGALQWTYNVDLLNNTASPAVDENNGIRFGAADNCLYAFDSAHVLSWSYETGEELVGAPTMGSDGRICIGSMDNRLYQMTSSGVLTWSYQSGNDIYGSPAIDTADAVYFGSADSRIYALSSDGTLTWSYDTGVIAQSSPAVTVNGRVFVGTLVNALYAVDSDGSLAWSYRTGKAIYSSPALTTGGDVCIGSDDNRLYALKIIAGTLKWSYQTGGTLRITSPAIGSSGNVYIGSSDNSIYAVDSGGALLWTFLTGAGVESSPIIGSDGLVYVGSMDNNFYCIGQAPTPTPTEAPVVPTATPTPTRTPTRTPTATPVPQAEVVLNGTEFSAGQRFKAEFRLNRSVERLFTAYAVVVLPDKSMLNCLTLGPEIVPVASNGPRLDPMTYPLMDLEVPAGIPGSYEVMAGFFDPSQPITKPEDAFLLARSPFTIL